MTRARLRWTLGLLLLALAVPSAILVVQTSRQLKWEAFHQQRQLTVELADRIDGRLQQLIAAEEARSVADYSFLTVADFDANKNAVSASVLQRSVLAQLPVQSEFPGLLGWFQVDAGGAFSSPVLPDSPLAIDRIGLDADELAPRRALAEQLLEVLSRNALAVRRPLSTALPVPAEVQTEQLSVDDSYSGALSSGASAPNAASPRVSTPKASAPTAAESTAAAPQAQANFDQLKRAAAPSKQQASRALGKVADLRLENAYSERDEAKKGAPVEVAEPKDKSRMAEGRIADSQRSRRQEQTALPALDQESQLAEAARDAPASAPLRIFDSEVDPFEFAVLGDGHFVLFRRVWRDGERSVQGALIEQSAFLRGALGEPFAASAVAPVSDLLAAWQGEVLQRFDGSRSRRSVDADDDLRGTLLHRARLSAPLADIELIWTIRQLPASPGASLVAWAGALLFAVLLMGFFALYRLGLRQLALARQQQDFIAAVSHELKTPLTSIRMYGELLQAGWASEEKKREYYAYIFDESERLSRLIANVLQLARVDREELRLTLKPHSAAMLFDLIQSKVHAQIERAGFVASFELDPACAEQPLLVDADAVIQVMINFVDNAVKFSASAAHKRIDIRVVAAPQKRVLFAVRDYGPGVPASLRSKIFQLFFRGGNELTRETQGTGIGLALVQQLAQGMRGEVTVEPREPGVEFGLLLRD